MGTTTGRRNFIESRRRVEDDGEDEENLAAVVVEDDSMSEASAMSDADDDADAEGSDGSEVAQAAKNNGQMKSMANGHRKKPRDMQQQSSSNAANPSLSVTRGDTEVMQNGLKITDESAGEVINLNDMARQPEEPIAEGVIQHEIPNLQSVDHAGERRRWEHEEYKKKRDTDPAFVPNRGGFFMHDHRSAAPGQSGFRPFGRGRGGMRGGRGSFPGQIAHPQPQGPADAQWAHDLHESIAQPVESLPATESIESGMQTRPNPLVKAQAPNRSFSRIIHIANVQIRVFLGSIREPIVFSAMQVNQHTCLPHHRPPLRRDKPVRISFPQMPIRYIFPSIDRSFIFIPRAMRPNQQGFGKLRVRGSLGGGYNNLGPSSSRRTIAYAGSAYSPSLAMSRRSSLAREMPAEAIIPPPAAVFPRPSAMAIEAGKPVVRLPPAAEQAQLQAAISPTVNLPQPSVYPLPQKPTFRENRPNELPMHHPKPERSLQVADIESPATLDFNPPPQRQQQPFHQQVPVQVSGQAYPPDPTFSHTRHPSHPSQTSGGTPLPQIPERAIHAQAFQPYPYQHPQGFFPQQYPHPVYYFPQADPNSAPGPSAAAPPFVPGQTYYYPMPVAPVPPPALETEPTTQAGTVAHERGGMVYYYNPADLAAAETNTPPYPSTYTVPPTSGGVSMGGMMTPPIQPFFPPPTVYYPTQ